jgi:hypothetical protein
VYGWIWRHLPFGLPGRIVGSLVLVSAAAALLWYLVFPAVDPLLPFNNDGQVTGPLQPPAVDSPAPSPAPSVAPPSVVPSATSLPR